jgi:probable rRNA maturation factor
MSDRPPSPKRARGLLELHSTIPRSRIRKDYLLSCARHAARHLKDGFGQLNFILVTDHKMARLHREYSGVAGTTDVLTFDLTDKNTRAVEGDVFICLDQARRQSSELKIPLYREVARLAVHGVLHLAGYRDSSDTEREQMRRLEDLSLKAGDRRQ